MLNNKKGMTLIEILVVIIILGVLSGISMVAYNTIFAKADLKTTEMKEKEIANIIDTWYQVYKEIPIKEKLLTGTYQDYTISLDDFNTRCNIQSSKLCQINFVPLIKDNKVSFKIDGDYYIYNYNGKMYVSYDYPKELIQTAVANFKKDNPSAGNPLIAGSSEIDTRLLVTKGYLDKRPTLKYTLLPNGLVDRLINQ